MAFTFYHDFDGTLGRSDETHASAVWWPRSAHWHPWSVDPFATSEITREQAQALAGPGADLDGAAY